MKYMKQQTSILYVINVNVLVQVTYISDEHYSVYYYVQNEYSANITFNVLILMYPEDRIKCNKKFVQYTYLLNVSHSLNNHYVLLRLWVRLIFILKHYY
jgi:hypothetical protein